jgi:hypothetical protein
VRVVLDMRIITLYQTRCKTHKVTTIENVAHPAIRHARTFQYQMITQKTRLLADDRGGSLKNHHRDTNQRQLILQEFAYVHNLHILL